eukprot:m.20647 g.20647  ORF g.20647 m.20647 type:complete len:551 (+) comp5269_c0_seq1:131-1783(+)
MKRMSALEIQGITFKNWCSYILDDRKPAFDNKISNMKTAFAKGIVLIEMIEKLSERRIELPNPHPKLKKARTENVVLALEECEKDGVFETQGFKNAENAGLRAEDIVEGRVDACLAFVFNLIAHFDILFCNGPLKREAGRSLPPASDVIIAWVRSFEEDEHLHGCNELAQSWRDGYLLYTLVRILTNDVLPVTLPKDPIERVELALDAALIHLGIPKLLTAKDICSKHADHLSMMVYLAQIRRVSESEERLRNPYFYLHHLSTKKKNPDPLSKDYLVNMSSTSQPQAYVTPVSAVNSNHGIPKSVTNDLSTTITSTSSSSASQKPRFPGPPLPPRQEMDDGGYELPTTHALNPKPRKSLHIYATPQDSQRLSDPSPQPLHRLVQNEPHTLFVSRPPPAFPDMNTSSNNSSRTGETQFHVTLRGWANQKWTPPSYSGIDSAAFPCNLLPFDSGARLSGPYWIVITPASLQLYIRQSDMMLLSWPLNHIVRYGIDNTHKIFGLEVGESMNDVYAGNYHFEMSHKHHRELYDLMIKYSQSWSKVFGTGSGTPL